MQEDKPYPHRPRLPAAAAARQPAAPRGLPAAPAYGRGRFLRPNTPTQAVPRHAHELVSVALPEFACVLSALRASVIPGTAVVTGLVLVTALLYDWSGGTGKPHVFSPIRPAVKSALNRLYGVTPKPEPSQQQQQQQPAANGDASRWQE